jgi:ABC-type bacteriocin/lantibiotic exporter with double-glycine peptidase domain
MRYIKQKHITGCGVAAVAMLTGVSYDKALKVVRPDRKPGDCACTSLKDMISGIETLGHKAQLSYKNTKLRGSKQNAMIIVSNPSRSPHAPFHVVVWDAEKQQILDPWGRPSTFTIDEKYAKKHHQYRISLV